MGAGADTWRLRVLDMDDHLTGGGLVGERAPRLELQDMLAQAHLTLQLLGPLGARLHIPGQKYTFLLFTIYFKDTNGKRWAIALFERFRDFSEKPNWKRHHALRSKILILHFLRKECCLKSQCIVLYRDNTYSQLPRQPK